MKLVGPLEIDESEFNDFIGEFKATNERLVPYSLNQRDMDFKTYIRSLQEESLGEGISENWVPASTYFLVDDEHKIYGAVNIRHRLNDKLMIDGGHVGYGIRPSARNQGYGTMILAFALNKIQEMKLRDVLVTCDKDNIGSAKVIQNNGGKLDSEIEEDGNITQRYWIKL